MIDYAKIVKMLQEVIEKKAMDEPFDNMQLKQFKIAIQSGGVDLNQRSILTQIVRDIDKVVGGDTGEDLLHGLEYKIKNLSGHIETDVEYVVDGDDSVISLPDDYADVDAEIVHHGDVPGHDEAASANDGSVVAALSSAAMWFKDKVTSAIEGEPELKPGDVVEDSSDSDNEADGSPGNGASGK